MLHGTIDNCISRRSDTELWLHTSDLTLHYYHTSIHIGYEILRLVHWVALEELFKHGVSSGGRRFTAHVFKGLCTSLYLSSQELERRLAVRQQTTRRA